MVKTGGKGDGQQSQATVPPGAPPGAQPAQPLSTEGSPNKTEGTKGGAAVDQNVAGTQQDYQLIRALDLLKGVSFFTKAVD